MGKFIDITGRRYGRLTVLERAGHDSSGKIIWKCICDCQIELPENERVYTYTTKSNLNRGVSGKKGGCVSCGCYHREQSKIYGLMNRKSNKYDLESYEYGVGYCNNGYIFFFDKEDYNYISQYTWHQHQDGYLRTYYDSYKDDNGKQHNKYIMMHQLLAEKYYPNTTKEMDHINGKPNDNRKINLREADRSQNTQNTKVYKTNKSGHKGVYQDGDKWKAYITYRGQRIHLGTYNTLEEAIQVREKNEKKYFGEFNRNDHEAMNDAV